MRWMLRRLADVPLYAAVVLLWLRFNPGGFWWNTLWVISVVVAWAMYGYLLTRLAYVARAAGSEWLRRERLISRSVELCQQLQTAVVADDLRSLYTYGLFSDDAVSVFSTLTPEVLDAFLKAVFPPVSSSHAIQPEAEGVKVRLASRIEHVGQPRCFVAFTFPYAGSGNRVSTLALSLSQEENDDQDDEASDGNRAGDAKAADES